jgi:ATP-dependent Clp protease ATP-binding subunit ClpA
MGFMPEKTDETAEQKAAYDAAVKKLFRPEFRNRIDGVITFDHLTKENMISIAEIFVDEMNDLPAAHNNNLGFSATPEAIEAMVEQSYDKEMGARPLKRFMNEYIKDMLADMILTEGLKDKEVIISYAPERDSFWIDTQPIAQAKPKPVKPAAASAKDTQDNAPSHAEPVGMQ